MSYTKIGSAEEKNAGTVEPIAFEQLPDQIAAGRPIDLTFALPAHPSNQLFIHYRVNGEERLAVRARPTGSDAASGTQYFLAAMPGLSEGDLVEYRPILQRTGMTVMHLADRATRGIAPSLPGVLPAAAAGLAENSPALTASVPRFQWASEFLGAFTVKLIDPPEYIGPGPDGLRINYFIESGVIRGPRINAKVTGGDWMSLRPDGIGQAESRITYETPDNARIMSRYTGLFDLGPDGYERAARNEFDPTPPLVMTPTFTTAHPDWLWLNRLQCLAVGRAKMDDLTVYLDIYAIRTGQPLPGSGLPTVAMQPLTGDLH
jgi:hypothetical protein